MTEAIKLFFVITFIVVLLRKKFDLGFVMFLSSILLGFIFHPGFYGITNSIYLTIINPTTLQLIGIVVLVYVLSSILRRIKSLEGVDVFLHNTIADYRLILFLLLVF